MAVITGGRIIEDARVRPASSAYNSTSGGYGPFTNAGAPTDGTSGTGAGVAAKGALMLDTTTPDIYINAGTLASPTWKKITRAP